MNHIAQMNMGFLLHPIGDPRIAEFENNLDRVNGAADRSNGFVWRLKDADYDLPENDAGKLFGKPEVALATLSVWECYADFHTFVFHTIHGRFLERRTNWFERLDQPSYVIWPVSPGHIPNLIEGQQRLQDLRANGASPAAYDFEFGTRYLPG